MGSATSRNVTRLVPFEPLPSERELLAIGGRWFTRPSDGRRLEYFVRDGPGGEAAAGPSAARRPTVINVVCTTATGHLYHCWRPELVGEVLKARGARLVNVSAAGVGASEPYGSSLRDPEVTTGEYLRRTSQDLLALLEEVHAGDVYVMGVSGGWEPAAHFAAHLHAQDPSRLLGVASVSGIPWMGVGRPAEFWEKGLGKKGWQMNTAIWFNRSWLSAYVVGAMFPMDPKSVAKGMPQEQLEQMKSSGHFDMLEDIGNAMNRSAQYWAFVSGFLGALVCNPDAQGTADLKSLQGVLVHLHYSSQDSMLPGEMVAAWLKEDGRLPHAQLFMTELHHMAVPMEKVLTQLLSKSSVIILQSGSRAQDCQQEMAQRSHSLMKSFLIRS